MSCITKEYEDYDVNESFGISSQMLQSTDDSSEVSFLLSISIIDKKNNTKINFGYIEQAFNKNSGELTKIMIASSPYFIRTTNIEDALHFNEAKIEANSLIDDSVGHTMSDLFLEMESKDH